MYINLNRREACQTTSNLRSRIQKSHRLTKRGEVVEAADHLDKFTISAVRGKLNTYAPTRFHLSTLSNITLQDSRMENLIFDSSDLHHLRWENSSLSEVELRGSCYGSLEFDRSKAKDLFLSGDTRLSHLFLKDSSFEEIRQQGRGHISSFHMEESFAKEVRLSGIVDRLSIHNSEMDGMYIPSAKLLHLEISRSNLGKGVFNAVKAPSGAKIVNTDCSQFTFSNCDFRGVDWTGSFLLGCKFLGSTNLLGSRLPLYHQDEIMGRDFHEWNNGMRYYSDRYFWIVPTPQGWYYSKGHIWTPVQDADLPSDVIDYINSKG